MKHPSLQGTGYGTRSYFLHDIPWTPTTPGKMKVLHPKIWVIITPKHEGFEFPWMLLIHSYDMLIRCNRKSLEKVEATTRRMSAFFFQD